MLPNEATQIPLPKQIAAPAQPPPGMKDIPGEGGEKPAEQSFLRKYWYIIVPAVILLLSGGGEEEAPKGKGGGGAKRK
jgi:hypothetical protein